MDIKDLNGKTIKASYQMKAAKFDDEGYLRLEFTDGTRCDVVAQHGYWTGKSEDELPTHICVDECDEALIHF